MNYKKVGILVAILLVIIAVAVVVLNNKNNNSSELSEKYPEIIAELERIYGKEYNFKVIGIKGGEIDKRDYKAYEYPEGSRTSDWQGKYFEDAYLLISKDYLENPFYVTNNFTSLRYNFQEACSKEDKPLLKEVN